MGKCTRFGSVSGDWAYRERRIGEKERERESVAMLFGAELDGGRRATMWVSPHTHTHTHTHLESIHMFRTRDAKY